MTGVLGRPYRKGSAVACQLDGYPLSQGTDGNGFLVVSCAACERRRARRCQDCGRSVRGRSWRCESHKLTAKQRAMRLSESRLREERNRKSRERDQRRTAEARERRLEQKREWRRRNAARVKLSKREGRLNGTWGYRDRPTYLKAMARQNARRAARKRELMRRKAIWYGRTPTCRSCGEEVVWDHRGRPRLDCYNCRPPRASEAGKVAA